MSASISSSTSAPDDQPQTWIPGGDQKLTGHDLPDAPSAVVSGTAAKDEAGFWRNLLHAYIGKTTPKPEIESRPCRDNPAPLTSPPFPFQVWPYGGAPTIGCDSGSDTPVMNAVAHTRPGRWLEHKRINFYGWGDAGANLSNSKTGGYANAPAAYAAIPNTVVLDQIAVYVERVPDTVQKDHFDYGFRVTSLYGLDYRYTTAKGLLSDQLLTNNKKYGLDFPMAYIDLYFPVKNGLNVRIGRTISVPDIEAQLAPNNYMDTHSLLYAVDAYTQTGVFVTQKLGVHWLLQAGLSAGNDVMPWVKKDATPTGVACLGYTWGKGTKNVYVCDNSINSGKYKYNNMNQYNISFYDKFSKNWHTSNEFYFMKEREVPAVGGPIPTQPNSNGAYCPAGLDRCTTYETAYVNYMVREIAKGNRLFKDGGSLIFRNGYLYDKFGQRTGTPTLYSDHVFGVNWYTAKGRIDFRPEVGIYHSYNRSAFDNGNHSTLKMLAGDLIFNF